MILIPWLSRAGVNLSATGWSGLIGTPYAPLPMAIGAMRGAQIIMIGEDGNEYHLHPHPSASGTADIVSLDFNPGNPKYPLFAQKLSAALDVQNTNDGIST